MKKFINELSFKKFLLIVTFFIAIIGLLYGGITLCRLLFDTNPGEYWDGSVATSFHSGSGTSSDPYVVSTASEFAYMQTGCTNGVYIRIDNDIYLNKGYVEQTSDVYQLYVGNKVYTLDQYTGFYYENDAIAGQLQKLIPNKDETSCHIDGNNHKIYGLYITDVEDASLFHNFSGSIEDFYIQSGLITGSTSTLVKETHNSNFSNIYYDGILSSSQEDLAILFNLIKREAIGNSSSINYNVSSQHAEQNYDNSSGYANKPGVYQYGTSDSIYFYRGSVENNNIIFAGFCWKIITTTGERGIRLIYNGVPNNGVCNATGSATTIGSSAFNSTTNNSKYTGYVVNNTLSADTNSTIKTVVDNWYASHLTAYTSFLDDAYFCNDRKSKSYDGDLIGLDNNFLGIGVTWYVSAFRSSEISLQPSPSLDCSDRNYMYTVSSSNGNGKLTYPVGLITSDEVMLAGGTSLYSGNKKDKTTKASTYTNNTTYYLYNGSSYWTMSPTKYSDSSSYLESVNTGIYINSRVSSDSLGVRPVITLRHDTRLSGGSGTSDDPYVVLEEIIDGTNLLDHIKKSETSDTTLVRDLENNGTVTYRYIGTSPENYVCMGGTQSNCSDGELYRIIGVFNDDVHGQTGKQLIKVVRASSFSPNLLYDQKGAGVGSRPSGLFASSSSDWSDAQLMYMLNGTHYVNSGYKIGGTSPIHNWSSNGGNISDGNTTFYKVNGSYYDGGGNVNKPASVSSGRTYSGSTVSIPGLNAAARDLVEEVRWPTAAVNSGTEKTPVIRNTEIGASSITNRPDYWIGKIGLISYSDFSYATSGGNNNRSRATCLNNGGKAAYSNNGCSTKNWLSFGGEYAFYFMTPRGGSSETVWGYTLASLLDWYDRPDGLDISSSLTSYKVQPALFLKDSVVYDDGIGTASQPYLLRNSSASYQTSVAYSALIGTSYNSTYNVIKIEGSMTSNNNVNGLINVSFEDDISNFEISSTFNSNVANLFIGVSNNSNLSNGYYKGNLITHAVYIYEENDISYSNVYAYGDAGTALVSYSCDAEIETGFAYESLDTSNACYKSKSEIKDLMNSNFSSTYWRIDSSKEPELLISNDQTAPTAAIVVTDTTTGASRSYNTLRTEVSAFQIKSSFTFTASNVLDNSAVRQVEYLISSSPLSNLDSQTFTPLSGPITVNTKGINIIYLKITDINYNVSYISSEYIIIDSKFTRVRMNGNTSVLVTPLTPIDYREPLVDRYSLNNVNYGLDKLALKADRIPAGTTISFVNNGVLYQYQTVGNESYIFLSEFKRAGTTNTMFGGAPNFNFTISYDFINATGSNFESLLVVRENNQDLIETDAVIEGITIQDINSSITLSNSVGTTSISSLGSTSISYTASANRITGGLYLILSMLDSNNNKINDGPLTGLSIGYNGINYYANNDGDIVIPIGSLSSTLPLTLNVEHLNSILLPGTYKIRAHLQDSASVSNNSDFNITTDYMKNHIIEKLLLVNENIPTKILDRESNNMTLSFTIKTLLSGTSYSSGNITAKVKLEKKETLSSSTYTTVNINNYLASGSTLSNGYDNLYPIGTSVTGNSTSSFNLDFNKNNTTPGAYRLNVKLYANGYEVKNQYIYFIVK